MELSNAMLVSASGMKAQSTRIRVISENMANADTTAPQDDGDPYRRKTVSFKNALDRATGVETVQVSKVKRDDSEFRRVYEPGHPSAGADGYVRYPNVNSLVEAMDMREAQRSFEANLGAMEISRTMLLRVVDLLRG